MLKRRICCWLFALGMVVSFAGCYEPLPISDQEMDLVAEYAAGVLVKYGTDSTERLLDREEQEQEFIRLATPTPRPTKVPTLTPTKSPVPTGGGSPSDKPTGAPTDAPKNPEDIALAITKLFDKKDFAFSYLDFLQTDLYQGENDMFAAASAGKRLFVLRFEITNRGTSSTTLEFNNNGLPKECIFTLRAGEKSFSPTLTLLSEDMFTGYEQEYTAGQKRVGVVVFEGDTASFDGNVSLSVLRKNGEKEDAVLIKIK